MIAKANCEFKERDRISDYHLQDVMNLGDLCLVGFPAPDEPDPPRFPLQLSYCKASELVQLRHTVAPELMFRTYWYNSSTNEAMVRHLKRVVLEARREVVLNEKDTVVDIGCNDGALLGHYPQYVRRIGFDPAKTVRPRTCDLFVNDFFSAQMYAGNSKAKIVTSIAMFYDVDDPVKFAQEVYSIMHEDGVWVIEMHYLPMMLEKNEVDAICHEHLCYYNLHSLSYVMRQAGLSIVRAEFNDTNGGSMLVFVKKSARAGAPSPDLQNQMAKEDRVPLLTDLMDFYVRCRQNKLALQELLTRLHGEGKLVMGYGASTKGSTLLQYCDIDKELLPAIADRNPRKWGREMPGNRIPIISEEEMRSLRPDYLLALPYHFLDSFMEREKDLLDKGCKFIVPVPEPAVIG